jgi:predicted lysophospholipase L1 biosynthesis ABC-type transport system permease subunit
LEGREFSRADDAHTGKVAIVNSVMARHYFGSQSAVGRRFEFNKDQYEIIGVARDAKYQGLREPTPRFIYFAALQSNSPVHSLEIRTTGSPLAVAGAVRVAIREVDSRLRIGDVATLETLMDQKLAREFLVTDIAGFFGGLTLLLVAVGVYGTLAYTVARRTDEIGLRIALGARASAVLRIVLGDILLTLLMGLAGGIAAALVAGRLVASMLFGLESTDPTTIALAILLMTAATLAAGYVPARRALRIEPMAALRVE